MSYCSARSALYDTDRKIRSVDHTVSAIKKSVQSLKEDLERDVRKASKIAFPLSIIVNGRFSASMMRGFSYRAGEREMIGIATYFDVLANKENQEYVSFQSSVGNLILPVDLDTAAEMVALAQQGHIVEVSGNEETPSTASVTARKPRGITVQRPKARLAPISGR